MLLQPDLPPGKERKNPAELTSCYIESYSLRKFGNLKINFYSKTAEIEQL